MKKIIMLWSLLILTITGCANQTNPNVADGNMQGQQYNQHATGLHNNKQYQNHNQVKTLNENNRTFYSSNNEVVTHLEELAKAVDGVNNAHVVLIGNTAVVGVDVDASLDRSRVGTIKYSVAEALQKDPYGVNSVVTADIDLKERIKEIRADMTNGKPIMGIVEELSDIVGRIIPQVPADLMPTTNESTSKQNQLNTGNETLPHEHMKHNHKQKTNQ